MIGKVLRGSDVGGLLRYLFGPGRANEHVDPHLVASWDGAPSAVQPPLTARGRHDVRALTGLLEQPLAVPSRRPDRPVWHCALRTAPGDRRLTDAEWREVARDVLDATGLARRGDDGGCRWVTVRHADDHVHLVVTLARQDGAPARPGNDFYRVGEACRTAEQRLHLTRTAPRDRTAARRPTRGEAEKATRQRRREPPRLHLQRQVRTAAAAAVTAEDYLAKLEKAGLLVRLRYSDRDPAVITGYAVALPGDRTATGRPVWFSGGSLAADLTWPKVTRRWQGPRTASPPQRLSRAERTRIWQHASATAATAASELRHLAVTDPAAGSDLAHATADVLSVAAHLVEGRRRGPMTAAADAFDRAGRDLHGRLPRPTPTGSGLRAVARLLATTGRTTTDDTTQLLALLTELAGLAEAVAHLRDIQHRAAQAAAARDTAVQLRAVGRTATPQHPALPRTATPTPGQRPAVHSQTGEPLPVHRSAPHPPNPAPSRRKVAS